jgi:hypothetical protein
MLNNPTESVNELHRLRFSTLAYKTRAPLSQAELTDLLTWRQALAALLLHPEARWQAGTARPAKPPRTSTASLVIASDASLEGYGALLMLESASRPAPREAPAVSSWKAIRHLLRPEFSHLDAPALESQCCLAGLWSRSQASEHITRLELSAVVKAVQHLEKVLFLEGTHLFVLTDATAVRSTLHRGGSVRPQMAEAYAPLQQLLQRTGATMSAGHIRGVANLWADRLSRQRPELPQSMYMPSAKSLAVARLAPQFHKWFNPSHAVDLFASPSAHVCNRFLSYDGVSPAWAADAMTADWQRLAREGPLYVFPPPALLEKVVMRLIALMPIRFTLVAPFFPHQRWCRMMMRATGMTTRTLPSDAILHQRGSPVVWPGVWITISSLPQHTPREAVPSAPSAPA